MGKSRKDGRRGGAHHARELWNGKRCTKVNGWKNGRSAKTTSHRIERRGAKVQLDNEDITADLSEDNPLQACPICEKMRPQNQFVWDDDEDDMICCNCADAPC